MKYFENLNGERLAVLEGWEIAVARLFPGGKSRKRDQKVDTHFFLLASGANQFRI